MAWKRMCVILYHFTSTLYVPQGAIGFTARHTDRQLYNVVHNALHCPFVCLTSRLFLLFCRFCWVLVEVVRNSQRCIFTRNMHIRKANVEQFSACPSIPVRASKGISLCSCRHWINPFYVANSTNAPIYQSAIYMNDIRHEKYMQPRVAVLLIWMHYAEVSACLF